MAESSFLWDTNGTGDGTITGYTEANMALLFQLFTQGVDKSGVAPDRDNELAVTGAATPVSVASGSAIVHGTPYVNTSAVAVTIPTPTTSTRVDRIVLRKSWSAQTVRVTRIAGTEGAGLPSISQTDGTTWDLPLFSVSITTGGTITLTDERTWLTLVGDGDVATAKLADSAVTAAKLASNAVTEAKVLDGAISQAKLGADTLHLVNFEVLSTLKSITRAVDYYFGDPSYGYVYFDKDAMPAGATILCEFVCSVTSSSAHVGLSENGGASLFDQVVSGTTPTLYTVDITSLLATGGGLVEYAPLGYVTVLGQTLNLYSMRFRVTW
jgi:hypothetical protein